MTVKVKTRKDMRKYLNKNVGETVTTQDFSRPAYAANYLRILLEKQLLERVDRGQYKVLKRIILRKKGCRKGQAPNAKRKDLSKIPQILNTSKKGLVLLEVEALYKEVTPPSQQVNRNYLYRLIKFAKDKGVIIEVGSNRNMRISDRGPVPKRLALKNKAITTDEWNKFIEEYIQFYSGKKEIKSTKEPKPARNVGKYPTDINKSFDEDRDNERKQFVENFFLRMVDQYITEKVSCLAVTGPDYNRHIQSLFSTIAKEVYIVEREVDVFRRIFNKALLCDHCLDKNVHLVYGDVDKVLIPKCQYVDLDLMCCISSPAIIQSVKIQTWVQSKFLPPEDLKFLTFTACIRNDGGPEKRLKSLRNILYQTLGAKLDSFQGGLENYTYLGNYKPSQLKYCRKQVPIFSDYGRLIDSQIITYQDTTPMLSVLVVYK